MKNKWKNIRGSENQNERIRKSEHQNKQKLSVFCLSAFCFSLSVFCFLILFLAPAYAALITNVEPTSLSDSSFIITWTTTDEKASTEIYYGVGGLTGVATVSGTTKYHSASLSGLFPNTTYQYRIKSGSTLYPPTGTPVSTFTTLARPTGEHLFDFAVINDLRYAEGKTPDTKNARGIAYSKAPSIIASEVTDINTHGVAFTVVNGNIVDSDTAAKYGDQAETKVKPRLELLNNKPADLTSNIANKYMPIPGFYDKINTGSYTTDWITNSFKPLTSGTSIESVYGYNAASKDADSVFNYQFLYKNYNFIFLDSVKKPTDATGSANLTTLYNLLSAESNTKTFIFMAYPAYNPLAAATKDYPIDIPTAEVGGALNISNDTAFRATIESFEDSQGNPIVAAVVSSHLGDNYLREINSISYVRQGPAVQYPTGYSVYKVYSNGYVKTFYKTTGGSLEADGDTKPFFEYARDQVSDEAGLPASVYTSFWLGSSSMRNFTFTYPFIPGVSPEVSSTAPVSNESAVSLNRPIIVTFSERMLTTDINSWVTVSPSVGTITARFLDSSNTILSVSHSSNFVEGQTYTITVSGSLAKDEGSAAMGTDYSFTFNTTGGTVDSDPPASAVTPLPSNSTTDPFPSFTGVASDDSGVINVEYRIDGTGNWLSAEAIDGTFNATSEPFSITIVSAVSAGTHALWLRTTDGVGNVSSEGVSAYSFTLAENKPTITIKVGGNRLFNGDTISSTPKFEMTIVSAHGLASARISVDGTAAALTTVNTDSNYYATHEVASALSNGIHGITVEAFDSQGNGTTAEVYPLYVQGAAAVAVQGTSLNYPNPYDPAAGNTSIGYTLSKPSTITLTIHDLSGNMIVKKTYSSTENGGQAGYNTVTWNGQTDGGSVVGNGIYIYLVMADGRVLSKGKLTVVKR
ncbi:hypothetical protein A2625_07840 [candidate division WOR-1 bacterium RIFCSPHIGHO2_01_FULL_53_15]|uniref:Fibronectin type-III domain-containing protein n=1 Tax=candidate division WOR-1 bacterium RIFCSPHIGHO2_01_FULL_53_15 TaxID=1802564 RepID=A0A1F4Q0A7_UNCSA|nr:MAG: hypothetical protein A2625_07840 [candidate division WOR-1 bacterium RIFCSPHIGHO2_01_FULL_53_15]OGC12621.1 MAG: hypothetical protein A3D23_02620 [candidate division WOR-1 bacterium RIFCSPHIGHO2_02_FULL_53_26]